MKGGIEVAVKPFSAAGSHCVYSYLGGPYGRVHCDINNR